MRSILVAFLSGVVFAAGLGIGGMTQPSKVVGFLDFAGDWDPSLIFVMLGAIGVHSLLYHLFRSRRLALVPSWVSLPNRKDIDSRLIGGAVIFGSGWGLAGYCPGPALTSIASGSVAAMVFSAAMLVGILAFDSGRMTLMRSAHVGSKSDEFVQDV